MIAVLAAVCAFSTNLSAQELKDKVSVSIGIAPYPYVAIMKTVFITIRITMFVLLR